MSAQEPLEIIAEQINGATSILVELLIEAVAEVHDDLVGRGFDPTEDPAHFNATVRRYVLEGLKPHFPDMTERNNNMSPIHLLLGPHQLRMIHAQDDLLPRPQTKARSEYYDYNDQGILELNVYTENEMVALPADWTQVEEATLVLLWSSSGPDLTLLQLCRPSMTNWPGEAIVLHTHVESEEDLDEIRRDDGGEIEGTGDDQQ